MTFTTDHSNRSKRGKRSAGGFTLMELMVGITLSGLVLAISTGSLLFLAKSTKGLGNYQEMNMESRFALEDFGSDARMTTNVVTATNSMIAIDVYDSAGGISRVSYGYDASTGTLSRTATDFSVNPAAIHTEVILKDVNSLSFRYFNLHGDLTTNPLEVKEVQIQAEMVRNVLSINNTNEIISARFMMRNRSVSS